MVKGNKDKWEKFLLKARQRGYYDPEIQLEALRIEQAETQDESRKIQIEMEIESLKIQIAENDTTE